jgi:putative transposase
MIPIIRQLRENHPKMGAREMYHKLKPNNIGRDKFEVFCFDNGFRVVKNRNYRKTTNSNGVVRFPNMVEGYELTGVYQVLVSDITYFELNGKFYYLTFIMDLYSREILGYSVSKSLRTKETTLAALKMVVRRIGRHNLKGTIIHSDGGGQYYDKEFRKYTIGLEMVNSMCKDVYENPHAERINGTIKNDYVKPWNPSSYLELQKYVAKAVYNYNTDKPHSSLGRLTPVKFREQCQGNTMKFTKRKTAIETENYSSSNLPVPTAQHNYQIV